MKFLSLILLLLISACGQRSALEFSAGMRDSESLSTFDFMTIESQILAQSCVGCHSQYKTFAGVKRELNQIKSSIEHFRMPKNSPLSQQKRNLLLGWIAAGGPEFENDLPGPQVSEVAVPTYKSISENILVPKCVICHNPIGQARFLDLSSEAAVAQAQDRKFGDKVLINLLKPEESYLLEVLNDTYAPMPPVASNLPRLSEDEITTIQKWIELNLP